MEDVVEVTKYQVWVNGTQVTEANKGNVLNDSNPTHSVTYTPATEDTPAKLILSNAVINNVKERPASGSMYYILPNGITAKEELELVVNGQNAITSTYGNAIKADNNLTISGIGSLTLNSHANMGALSLEYESAILTIKDHVSITASVTRAGINNPPKQSDGRAISAYSIRLKDSATVTATNDEDTQAVLCKTAIYVNGQSKLTAIGKGNKEYNYSIYAGDGLSYPGHVITASENLDGSEPDTIYDPAKLTPDIYKVGYKHVQVNPTVGTIIIKAELNQNTLSMKVGATETLTPMFTPTEPSEKTVTWASSDKTVATVDQNGKVTAVGVGTATITVLTKDGGYTDTCTVTVSNPSSSSGSHTTYYPVNTPAKSEGGSVVVSQKSASKGSAVTVTVTPESGYQVSSVQAVDKDGKKLTLTDKGDGKYSFVMPGSKVAVSASFAQVQKPEEKDPYGDVSKDSYYYDAVKWAAETGVTTGVGDGLFAPEWVCTRGQIVTFLWRASGSPAPKATELPFTDVAADAYYAQAVLWAVENGITNGTSETTFSPDQTCTRAHAVAFLYRMSGSPAAAGSTFSDVAADAYYRAAVAWAVEKGITNGTSGTTFSPDDTCTRGQIVTFLCRLAQTK